MGTPVWHGIVDNTAHALGHAGLTQTLKGIAPSMWKGGPDTSGAAPTPGGIAAYAGGGMVGMPDDSNPATNDTSEGPTTDTSGIPPGSDPRMAVIANAEDALNHVQQGGTLTPQHTAALHAFHGAFGPQALQALHANVKQGMMMRSKAPRLIQGPGGPTSDGVPAIIDNVKKAKLSSGEFVMPVAAVHGAGQGDPVVGAQRLHALATQLAAVGQQGSAAAPAAAGMPSMQAVRPMAQMGAVKSDQPPLNVDNVSGRSYAAGGVVAPGTAQTPGASGNNPMAVQPHVNAPMPKWMQSLDAAAQGIGSALTAPHDALYDPQYGAPAIDPATGQAQPIGMRPMADAGTLAGLTTLGAGAMPAEAGALNMGIQAYHGSPHSFGQFSNDAIGTGEGAQAYGYGHYFAENEGVARSYRDALTPAVPITPAVRQAMHTLGDLGFDSTSQALAAVRKTPDWMQRWDVDPSRSPEEGSAVATIQQHLDSSNGRGSMYHVDINAEPNQMLDWMKPLSEHPQAVQDAVQKLPAFAKPADAEEAANVTGQRLYYRLSNRMGDAAAAQTLQQAGIPGIKYLDSGSRGAGAGTHNFVVFDPQNIAIQKKYAHGGIVGYSTGGIVDDPGPPQTGSPSRPTGGIDVADADVVNIPRKISDAESPQTTWKGTKIMQGGMGISSKPVGFAYALGRRLVNGGYANNNY